MTLPLFFILIPEEKYPKLIWLMFSLGRDQKKLLYKKY